ncbi:MAG: hypothetical protein NC122_07330 [Faecalibacterium sp.]|nr:hypothetical protein [Ruminococcus sp.]MCM1393097.1 hypothetical protein [Ruminococcus sp.]MCM1486003.1 hypothetical protein [Faecalibacterium sp.]
MIVEIMGTEYKFGFSFVAVLTIMLMTADNNIAAVSIVSSLLHECGHLVFMYAFHDAPKSVEFGGFGIRIERLGVSATSYKHEAIIAIGGVCVNFILALTLFVVFYFFGSQTAFITAFVNIFIASLNLMPVGMLDAGRFLRYILLMRIEEQKTERLISRISDITVICFTAFCIVYTVILGFNISLTAVAVYLIFTNLKRS